MSDTDDTPIPAPALVVLIGPSSAGKSTWARANFAAGQVLSTDDFRAFCGAGPDDQTAGTEAFALVEQLMRLRLHKGLTTVVDTLGLDEARRAAYRVAASEAGMACVAVGFDTDPAVCHDRNRDRPNPLPKTVLDRQIRQWRQVRPQLADEGFDTVIVNPGGAYQVPADMAAIVSPEPTGAGTSIDATVEVDLVVSRFDFGDTNAAQALVDIATTAERVGFRALWVMDHFRQIPQVGRAWEPMFEPYTTLAYLAASTTTLRLGTMVTNVEHRNVGLLAKIVATLDVLSNGRAECGIGAGWFDTELAAYGYPVNSNTVRLDTLDEALQALPLLWGPGAKAFEGRHVSIPEAMAYPRPVQDQIPILVGGGGERRTLRLAAAHAHACNFAGTDLDTVARKIEVVQAHCRDLDRDPDTLLVTTLNPLVHASSGHELAELVDRLRPANRSRESFMAANRAATTAEHGAYFRRLASLGVRRVCVSLVGDTSAERVEDFGSVIEALGSTTTE